MAVTKLQIVSSANRGEYPPQPLLRRQWIKDGWSFSVADYLPVFIPGQIYATLTEDNLSRPPYTVDLTGHGLTFCGRQDVQTQFQYAFCRMDDNEDYILSLPKAGNLYLPVTRLDTIFQYLRLGDEKDITHWAIGSEAPVLKYAMKQLFREIYPMRYPEADLYPVLKSGTSHPYRMIGRDLSRGIVERWEVIPGTPDLSVDIAFKESSARQSYVLQSLAQFQDLGILFS